MTSRKAWILALTLVIVCLGVLMLIAPIAFPSLLRSVQWALAEADIGLDQINVGDRFVEVKFTKPFASRPLVSATPQTPIGSMSFAVVKTDSEGFRLELSEPAPTPLWFSWSAAWSLYTDLDYMAERGLPSRLTAETRDGQAFLLQVEAYRADRPAELLIPTDQLQDLGASDDEIARSALVAARKSFNEFFTCSWLDKLRRRVHARAYLCPAWGPGVERDRWGRLESGLWSVTRGPRGLEVALKNEGSPPVQLEDAVKPWAELVRVSKALDLFPHNNQVLDFLDAVTADGLLEAEPKLTVIHFDAHSDLWAYPAPSEYALSEDISNFLDTAILKGVAGEVYWVLPDWTREEPYAKDYWFDNELPDTPEPYVQGPRDLQIFVDREAGALYFGSPPQGRENLPVVHYHKVLLSELPDFAGRDNVYLEIDGDYFSNTGFDTEPQGHINPSRGEMLSTIAKVADTLKQHGVKPRLTSWCLSPDYTAPEDELDQDFFFLSVLDRLQAKDYLMGYAHSEPTGRLPRARNVKRQSVLDQYLLELRYQDYVQSNGNRRIDLKNNPAELGLAQRLAMQRLNLDEAQSLALLHRLDRFDGIADGSIDLGDVEYFSAVGNVEGLTEGR